MKKMLTSLALLMSLASAHAQAPASKPVKLGVLNDQSGQYADAAGPASVEVARMDALMASHNWCDLGRQFFPAPERLYTWWSYRAQDWAVSDRGRRLDHIWTSPEVARHATSFRVVEAARSWDKPSDHVPIIAEFDL